MNKKQITFYGKYSEGEAISWLNHFRECFEIVNVNLKIYTKKVYFESEKRCRLTIKYK